MIEMCCNASEVQTFFAGKVDPRNETVCLPSENTFLLFVTFVFFISPSVVTRPVTAK